MLFKSGLPALSPTVRGNLRLYCILTENEKKNLEFDVWQDFFQDLSRIISSGSFS